MEINKIKEEFDIIHISFGLSPSKISEYFPLMADDSFLIVPVQRMNYFNPNLHKPKIF